MDFAVLADAMAAWMREYAAQAGAQGFVVGLSGGVDSAVTAALAGRAVGVDHVLAVWLPCHSLPEDEGYARLTAQALGLDLLTVDLCAAFDALIAAVPPGPDIARANIKPRLRMTAWYYLAQSHHYLVAGTSNRPEMMVGYFTKYGDGGVDIEPLGELYKHEVRALARVLGVPEPVVSRAPTAGLWVGQTDEGELGLTYAELDAILAALAEGRVPAAPEAVVARVQRMIAGSAHKRALPPIFHVERI
ncbi:MAG TPA: NAD(+) synthase [Anaerolineae bacterium]|nr:NAD(+) synthase [Anaerolineae bacterium]HQH39492.1 NAD(+) synthase [Anaerolineae bacterium]